MAEARGEGETARTERWVLRGLLLVMGLLPLCAARSQLLTGDPTYYLGLATSLVSGDGYTFMNERHTTYPPGLPLLLAPIVWLFGPDVLAAQMSIASFALLASVAVHASLKAIAPRLAVPVLAATVLSYPFFALATLTLRAELPYLAASATVLWLVATARDDRPGRSFAAFGFAAMTVLLRTVGIALPFALLAAWAHRRARGAVSNATDRVLAAGAAGGLLAAIGWAVWTHGGEESYVGLLLLRDPHIPDLGRASLSAVLMRLPAALAVQLTHVAALPLGGRWLPPTWTSPAVVVLALALVAGLLRLLRARNPVVAWYVLAYVGILLLWPFDEGPRFIVPILPYLLVVIAAGVTTIVNGGGLTTGRTESDHEPDVSEARRRGLLRLAGLLVAVVVLVSIFTGNAAAGPGLSAQPYVFTAGWTALLLTYAIRRRRAGHLQWTRVLRVGALGGAALFVTMNVAQTARHLRDEIAGADRDALGLRPMLAWIGQHLDARDIVMSEMPSAVYWYTGRRAIQLPVTSQVDSLVARLHASRATHLLIMDPVAYPYYLPTESRRFALLDSALGSGSFTVAHRSSRATLYRVKGPSR